jgi:hypothetical protein
VSAESPVTVLVPLTPPVLLEELPEELLDELPEVPEVPDALAEDGFVTGGADWDLKPSSNTSTATVLVTARMTRRMEVSELSYVRT